MGGSGQIGVGFLLCVTHADKVTGNLHGHTYEAVCWFNREGHEAEKLRTHCQRLCADLDHSVLPPELAWAEDLGDEVKRRTNAASVDINRPLERLYVRGL